MVGRDEGRTTAGEDPVGRRGPRVTEDLKPDSASGDHSPEPSTHRAGATGGIEQWYDQGDTDASEKDGDKRDESNHSQRQRHRGNGAVAWETTVSTAGPGVVAAHARPSQPAIARIAASLVPLFPKLGSPKLGSPKLGSPKKWRR